MSLASSEKRVPTVRLIGQELELVGLNVDYISPMIYPSHYANNSKGHDG